MRSTTFEVIKLPKGKSRREFPTMLAALEGADRRKLTSYQIWQVSEGDRVLRFQLGST